MTTNQPSAVTGEWTHAYCDTCKTIQPVEFAVGGKDTSHRFDGAEIVCTVCFSILLTLFNPVQRRAAFNGSRQKPTTSGVADDLPGWMG